MLKSVAVLPEREHQCDDCGKRYASREKMMRHVRNQHGMMLDCVACPKRLPYTRRSHMRQHIEKKHGREALATFLGKMVAVERERRQERRKTIKQETGLAQAPVLSAACPVDGSMSDVGICAVAQAELPTSTPSHEGELFKPADAAPKLDSPATLRTPPVHSAGLEWEFSPVQSPVTEVELLATPEKRPPTPSLTPMARVSPVKPLNYQEIDLDALLADVQPSPSMYDGKVSRLEAEIANLKESLGQIQSHPVPRATEEKSGGVVAPRPPSPQPSPVPWRVIPLEAAGGIPWDHDPRLAFARAPSSIRGGDVAATLAKVRLFARTHQGGYSSTLGPVDALCVRKEERCRLPDGTEYSLDTVWVRDPLALKRKSTEQQEGEGPMTKILTPTKYRKL